MDTIADDAVAATNDYAAICKYQAISLGYYKDEHLRHFLSPKIINSSQKKAPEIMRGYFVRSASIAFLVEQFMATYPDGQVISIGAGYDSLYWRLRSEDQISSEKFKFIEVDMPSVTMHKVRAIRRHSELSKYLSNINCKGDSLHSDQYHLLTFDLRTVDKTSLMRKLKDCDLDTNVPTLCVAECVLVFMPLESSSSLIHWLRDSFKSIAFVNYEQCNIDDRFGNIMLSTMSAQNCDLMGAEACKSIITQKERFISNGLTSIQAWTLSQIYNDLLSLAERERIESIEFLDEGVLLDQLLEHYCIIVASNSGLDWIPQGANWRAISCTAG